MENESLLSKGDDEIFDPQYIKPSNLPTVCALSPRVWIILLSTYSILATCLFPLAVLLPKLHSPPVKVPYSPAREALKFKLQNLEGDPLSVFSSPPSQDRDDAWIKLLTPVQIGVSKDELRKSNYHSSQNLLKAADDQYVGMLGVYHELHCLRRILWNYDPQVYFANQTKQQRAAERAHAIHCIESIRQSLMCSPNTALYTFVWRGNGSVPRLETGAQRSCVSWEGLDTWAVSRSIGWNPQLERVVSEDEEP